MRDDALHIGGRGTAEERRIAEAIAEAKRALPELPAPSDAFVEKARAAGETLCAADLHLAVTCGVGDAKALQAFEREVMPKVRAAITRIDRSPAFIDEAVQAVRERFFVGVGGGAPKILQYSGEAPLANWARVAAVRTAINLRQARSQAQQTEPEAESEALMAGAMRGTDPELGYLREDLRGKFKQAFADALAGLEPRERNLLRLHYVEGLSLERMGAIYGNNKSTLSRRLERVRTQLIEETREALRRRFGIRPRELQSAMRLFTSRFSLSVTGLLADAKDEEA